jgi:hypothetical protein
MSKLLIIIFLCFIYLIFNPVEIFAADCTPSTCDYNEITGLSCKDDNCKTEIGPDGSGGDKCTCVLKITPSPTHTPTPSGTSSTGGGSTKPGGAGQTCTLNGKPGILTALGCVPTEPTEFITAVSRLLTGAGGGIALLLIIAGAFRMITSAGNPDAVKAGSEQITSAIIGLLFIIFAVLLLQIIGVQILDLPGFEN